MALTEEERRIIQEKIASGEITVPTEDEVEASFKRFGDLMTPVREHLERAVSFRKFPALDISTAIGRDSTHSADKKTDNSKNNSKKLPPTDVNDAARYIREQRKQISDRKRPEAGKRALIIEHVGDDQKQINRLCKELQPSRFGWLLDI